MLGIMHFGLWTSDVSRQYRFMIIWGNSHNYILFGPHFITALKNMHQICALFAILNLILGYFDLYYDTNFGVTHQCKNMKDFFIFVILVFVLSTLFVSLQLRTHISGKKPTQFISVRQKDRIDQAVELLERQLVSQSRGSVLIFIFFII